MWRGAGDPFGLLRAAHARRSKPDGARSRASVARRRHGTGRPADRRRAARGHHVGDPARGVGGHVGDLRAALGAKHVEKPAQGRRVAPRRGPHQPATVVVDHDRQVAVLALVGDLIDTDPPQIREPVDALSVSAQTREMIAPTVRQAIRINSQIAVFEHATASQATVSSKAKVCPAPWRAHGTATTTPCAGQFTRGASASSTACTVPQSRARQRRRPSPRSYQGALRPTGSPPAPEGQTRANKRGNRAEMCGQTRKANFWYVLQHSWHRRSASTWPKFGASLD